MKCERWGVRVGGQHIIASGQGWGSMDREFFIDNLMVRIHLIIEMILVDRPCAMGG